MNYRPSYKRIYPWSFLIFLAVILAAFSIFAGRESVSPVLTDFGRGIWLSRIGFADFFGLRRESEDLKSLEATFQFLLLENQLLKEYFGRSLNSSYLLAAVLVRPPQIPYDTLILDVGELEGVEPDDLVLAYPNVALGKIIEVGKHSSRVLLFSSPEQKINVLVGPETLAAQASGRGSGNFVLELPREFKVPAAAVVSLPRLEPYILGQVAEVENPPAASSQLVRVSSPVNINQLKWVFLAK